MGNIEFNFSYRSEPDIATWFETSDIYYYFWGALDIFINGISFFHNYSIEWGGKLGSSGIGRQGLTIPIFPFVIQLASAPEILKNHNRVFISDDQIDKSIEFALQDCKKELVTFGICLGNYVCRKDLWFNGEYISRSKKIPTSSVNVIGFEDFSSGCINSVNQFLRSLLEINPELSQTRNFKLVANKVGF